MSQSSFDVTTHFNLGSSLEKGLENGITALQHHFGGARNNIMRLSNAMRACARDWGKYGNFYAFYTNRNEVDSTIGKALLEGVQHVVGRFGDTATKRAEINKVFKSQEDEWNAQGHNLTSTDAYDQVC